MRTTVIIERRGEGYISTVSGQHGGGHRGSRCGLTADAAARRSAALMIEYVQTNNKGGDLLAPTEVLEHVPAHLRTVHPSPAS